MLNTNRLYKLFTELCNNNLAISLSSAATANCDAMASGEVQKYFAAKIKMPIYSLWIYALPEQLRHEFACRTCKTFLDRIGNIYLVDASGVLRNAMFTIPRDRFVEHFGEDIDDELVTYFWNFIEAVNAKITEVSDNAIALTDKFVDDVFALRFKDVSDSEYTHFHATKTNEAYCNYANGDVLKTLHDVCISHVDYGHESYIDNFVKYRIVGGFADTLDTLKEGDFYTVNDYLKFKYNLTRAKLTFNSKGVYRKILQCSRALGLYGDAIAERYILQSAGERDLTKFKPAYLKAAEKFPNGKLSTAYRQLQLAKAIEDNSLTDALKMRLARVRDKSINLTHIRPDNYEVKLDTLRTVSEPETISLTALVSDIHKHITAGKLEAIIVDEASNDVILGVVVTGVDLGKVLSGSKQTVTGYYNEPAPKVHADVICTYDTLSYAGIKLSNEFGANSTPSYVAHRVEFKKPICAPIFKENVKSSYVQVASEIAEYAQTTPVNVVDGGVVHHVDDIIVQPILVGSRVKIICRERVYEYNVTSLR